MGLVNAAVTLASEAPIDNPAVSAWWFGAFTLGALVVGLVVVMMLKVGR
ncbi:MAG: hypothetical protein PHU75_05040 [Candidatus Nanopelagicales bacterium]|nr:hypothetical protein [Candidatus Nanopelagicales bacterium]